MNEMQPEYILSLWVTLNQNNQCSQSGTDRKRDSKKAGLPDPQQCHLLARSQAYHTVSISVPRIQNLVGKCAKEHVSLNLQVECMINSRVRIHSCKRRHCHCLVLKCEDVVFNVSTGLAGRSRTFISPIHARGLFIRTMHTGRGRRDGRLVVATLAWCAAVAIPAVPETHTPQMSSMGFVLSESSARGPHCSRQRGGRTLACR